MNKVESFVYGMVRKHPFIKKSIKTIYQGFFDLLPKDKEYFFSEFDFKEGYFFGFHDVSAISNDETKILANKVPFEGRMPIKGEKMAIGYFDFDEGKIGAFHKIAESGAWNYHKGCRMQWLDNKRIIFNTEKNGKLVSQITDIEESSHKIVDYPIDAVYVDKEREQATSFCYERLNRCMPGYGYSVNDGDSNDSYPSDLGLYLIDLKTGERELLVSLDYLAQNFGTDYKEGYTHFVTHTEFSKDGRYISFLYRAAPIGLEGKDMHKTWIMVYDIVSKSTISLPTQESGSHYVWNNKNQIIASCIIDGNSCHVLYDINNIDKFRIIAGNTLNSDGHQSFINDNVFVTDTYPDKRRMARLYKVSINNSEVQLIGKVYSPKKFQTTDVYCHIACDLHPRVSPSGRFVCFDSPRTGKRGLYVMKLDI